MAPLALLQDIVYGPVQSRRLGRSLGVNVLPAEWKLCNFNCTYCQYGWSAPGVRSTDSRAGSIPWPEPTDVAHAVSEALRRVREKGTGIDYVTLAGHGEPTLHPKFGAIVSALRIVRDCAAPGASIAVLSNSSTVNRPDVRAALQLADERYMKLDAGDQGLMRRLNGTRLSIGTVVDGLRRLNQVVIQAMFVRDAAGGVDNSSPAAVDAWIQALRIVQPVAVDIYTLDRSPALDTLRPVPAGRLKEIAGVVRDAGLVARVYDRMIGSGDQRVTGRGSLTWR